MNKIDPALNTLEDLGFNLSSNFYYYNQSNDSVTYNCFLAPIKNAKQIDALYTGGRKKFNSKDGLRTYYSADSSEIVYWNDEMLLFAIGSAKQSYFSRQDVIDRFGLISLDLEVDSSAVTVVSDTTYIDTAVDTIAVGEEAEDSDSLEVDMVPVTVEDSYVSENYKNIQKQKAIIALWTDRMLEDAFSSRTTGSILNNKDFITSLDDNAEASIWLSGADKLMNSYMPDLYSFKGINFLNGYGAVNAKLYLEKQSIKLSTSITFNDAYADVFKKVYKRKVNKNFLKYMNEDKMIGYMAYAMDTKAYLQEYPKLISNIYGSLYADEIGMATDLFSLLLDEEAISKVVKGDGLFIFNGLSQKEATFKSYDYNEDNFETKEVTKTKKEILPDFLFMLSTEDTKLLDKLIAYGTKKQMIQQKSGYFELAIPKTPLAIFVAIKNGILFFGTDETEFKSITGNTFVGNISSKHKKRMISANYSAYFNPKKMAGKIPLGEMGGSKEMEKVNGILTSIGDIYLKSNPIKGNTLSGEISMDVPATHQNSLRYLFSIIENVQK
ncbi:hypothetical protein [Pedobacter frigoris]|uniref:hypothetical protein n=1 Tax=Pedobacter frigoris TaxID=2571272 RepID=UPI0029310C60|nr:hypothetical protein [Pedobacter frigoris]